MLDPSKEISETGRIPVSYLVFVEITFLFCQVPEINRLVMSANRSSEDAGSRKNFRFFGNVEHAVRLKSRPKFRCVINYAKAFVSLTYRTLQLSCVCLQNG